MATKHTEHYQLNLWEPEDSFLRTEFNENSSKIDAALWALETKSLYIPIGSMTTTEEAAQFTVDMSDVDWASWEMVLLKLKLYSSTTRDGYVWINDNRYGCNYGSTSSISTQNGTLALVSLRGPTAPGYSALLLLPHKRPDSSIAALCCGGSRFGYGYMGGSTAFQEVTHLTFAVDENQTLKSGCTVELFGIR